MIICQCFMWMESRKISTGVACNKMEIRSQPHDMFAAHLLHNTSISGECQDCPPQDCPLGGSVIKKIMFFRFDFTKR